MRTPICYSRISCAEPLGQIELLQAAQGCHTFVAHAHDEHAFGVIDRGALRTRIGKHTTTVHVGQLLAIGAEVVHTGEPVDSAGYAYRMVYVAPAAFEHLVGNAHARPVHRRWTGSVVGDAALSARVSRALMLLGGGTATPTPLRSGFTERPAPEPTDALSEVLVELAAYITPSRAARHVPRASRVIATVRDYLESEYSRVVSLAELSTIAGLSAFHLSRTFRLTMGLPPYAYLAVVRVRRAREMIARGIPLSVVTHEAGFSDQSHFTRHFKRVFGLPPGAYARQLRSTHAIPAPAFTGVTPMPSLIGASRDAASRAGDVHARAPRASLRERASA